MKTLLINSVLALSSLRVYGLRTFLTVLGMVVGVAMVVTVVSVGGGVQQVIVGQLETFGGNTIFTEVRVPRRGSSGLEITQGVQITTLKDRDQRLVELLPNVTGTYGVVMGQEKVVGPRAGVTMPVMGTDEDYVRIDGAVLRQGRFFTQRDGQRLSKVVVLGSEAAERLFGAQDPVGRTVRMSGSNYQVMGVMAPRGTVFFQNMDLMVYMPKETLQKSILGIDYMLYFVTQISDERQLSSTVEQMRRTLRRSHGLPPNDPDKDDFLVTTMVEALELLQTITGGAQLVLLLVAGISLLVGGVGIMNTMYVSVLERTREIGLKRALGASAGTIMGQFLLETLIIAGVGSVVGIVIGALASLGIAWVADYMGYGWTTPLSFGGMLLALGVSSGFAVVFGYYPARKAARLHPVDALRSEV